MLKPGGTLSFAVGNLSMAAGVGGRAADAQSETCANDHHSGARVARTRNPGIVLLSTFYVEIPGLVLPFGPSRNDSLWTTAGSQCFVTGWSEKSRIASANGNSSTISP